MNPAQRVLETSRTLARADGASLPEALREFLSGFIGRPYMTGPAVIEGPDGQRSEPFVSVVAITSEGGPAHADGQVAAARAAAAIDGCETLTLEGLRAAYGRIGTAKRLRQIARPERGAGQRVELLGLVLGLRSDLPLEAIAEEMQRLNDERPAAEWPDMVVVADTGLVQYAVQFPGENVTGDFFLPGERPSYAAPMYIVMVMKPTGETTLNRMLAFLVGHLALFAPGADVPPFPEIVEGVPNTGLTLTGYQCNLAGELVPVPRQFYNDRFLAPLPFTIEDGRGGVLATVQFLPWQGGGVVLLRGRFPLV